MLAGMTIVDLSLPLGPDTIMWPGAPAPSADVAGTVADSGFYARVVHVFEHSGTHFDAPCHMVDGTHAIQDVPADTLIAPAVVIDISAHVADNPDTLLSVEQVHAHEREHGQIPAGSCVLLRTGWENRQSDPVAYKGPEGDLRFPGFGVDAAQLIVDRGVVGLGIDTLGIDAGCTGDEFPVHKGVSLLRNVWHLENLTNLAALPATGATVFVGVPRLLDGSGFPCRVLALVPQR